MINKVALSDTCQKELEDGLPAMLLLLQRLATLSENRKEVFLFFLRERERERAGLAVDYTNICI